MVIAPAMSSPGGQKIISWTGRWYLVGLSSHWQKDNPLLGTPQQNRRIIHRWTLFIWASICRKTCREIAKREERKIIWLAGRPQLGKMTIVELMYLQCHNIHGLVVNVTAYYSLTNRIWSCSCFKMTKSKYFQQFLFKSFLSTSLPQITHMSLYMDYVETAGHSGQAALLDTNFHRHGKWHTIICFLCPTSQAGVVNGCLLYSASNVH